MPSLADVRREREFVDPLTDLSAWLCADESTHRGLDGSTGVRLRPLCRAGAPELLACVILGRNDRVAVVTRLRRFGLYAFAEVLRHGDTLITAAELRWLRERAFHRTAVTVFSTTEDVFA